MRNHIVGCPHCGRQVLDHMTECPHCGGELKPSGYRPMDAKKLKIVKAVCYSVGAAVAVGLAVFLLFFRK